MKIELDFIEGINPPDDSRPILIYLKKSKLIVAGYYNEEENQYITHPNEFKQVTAENVMWAEQTNEDDN